MPSLTPTIDRPDHLDRLFRAAYALCGTCEEAENLVQDTLERVLRKPRRLRGDDDLGYLLRALRNRLASQRRSPRRRPQINRTPGQADLVEDPRATAPDAVTDAKQVYATIASLPPDFREALVAVDVVGLSYAEAARALRVRGATLTTRLHRARQRVAGSLLDGDERSTAWARATGR